MLNNINRIIPKIENKILEIQNKIESLEKQKQELQSIMSKLLGMYDSIDFAYQETEKLIDQFNIMVNDKENTSGKVRKVSKRPETE